MLIKNEERHHAGSFYVEEDGKRVAEMRYLIRGDIMNIYHTEVSPKLSGHNIGFELVETGVKFARENNLQILPTCSFARSVFDRTPEFRDVRVLEEEE
ncbi:MAG TPA: GNAT family N-acetyltransferase [Mucilaginibacter sp.]|nr:GNAT family N-acetyltransferase [Mucilaginibacter sp.]